MVKPEAPSIGPAGQFGDSHLPGPLLNSNRMEMWEMTDNEKELIHIIRDSNDPEAVAQYFFSLFEDYLRTSDPSPEMHVASPLEST
jgi:hypothetical protein